MNFDPKEFRRALGNFATGVTVVTAQDANGNKVGVTANSFNSVSLDPPLVLWSLAKSSGSYQVFEHSEHFAVNILAADQIDLSNHFAKPSDDKFAEIDFDLGVGNSPILKNTTACFQCEKYQVIDGGDHWIMLGKVVAFDHVGRSPLLYVQGSYAGAIPFTGASSNQNVTPSSPYERLNNNAFYLMNKVLQKVQENYLPKQSSTGLNTSEARLLLILSDGKDVGLEELKNLVTIPDTDVDSGLERLTQTGLITDTLTLTTKGQDMAERLWDIAEKQQDDIFGQFNDGEYENFKQLMQRVLKQLP
ncbi:p-hydroxyphenylacetate 3-hydroxylase reductase component [Marinomonas transparens]|uniref:Flavin reductase family protein n=1 Tax=Marinomonas transparens TaxID=2795388 RepID=A0A934N3D8_9GAMM|nr:flavin reductase family protein [Marinomonas transparens]MBJ7539602.1 flavin reductase family protein [Marinomonas transparens]